MNPHSVIAPANIALIKYWGLSDNELMIPCNPSISMTLSQCVTHTTVQARLESGDEILIHAGRQLIPAPPLFAQQVIAQLHRLREIAASPCGFRVATCNHFPTAAGIASSASGFAALTLAACDALGLTPDMTQLSRWTRMSGSGSATRSLLGGFVQWPENPVDGQSPAHQLAPANHWPLCDWVVIVDDRPKLVSSRSGHQRAHSSPHFTRRQQLLAERLERLQIALRRRDFGLLAEVVEEEAIELHLIAMTGHPATFYWHSATLTVLEAVRRLRAEGLNVCATVDAGPNVHVLCVPEHHLHVRAALAALPGVIRLIEDRTGEGPQRTSVHLI